MNITKKNTTSVRKGLFAFAAFIFIGFAMATCGDTPDGGNPGDPGNNNSSNNNNGNSNGGKTEHDISIKGGGTGSSVSHSKAKKDTKVTLKPGTLEGFGFKEWANIKPAGLKIAKDNTFTMPDEPVEVTATWEAGVYDITVNQDGGSGSSAEKHSAKKDESITLTGGTRTGYTFDGWTVVKPAAGLTFTSDNTFTMPNEVVEVTAKWKAIDFTITVHQGGGSGSSANKTTAPMGNEITLTPGNRAGYTFDGWKVDTPSNFTITGNTFTMPAAHVEVTATYKKAIDFTITVHQGGGSGSMASKTTANVGETITLTPGNRAGYTFDGWADVKPAGLIITTEHTFIMPASNVEVTATWKGINYTITIDQNGGSGATASKNSAYAGETITLTSGTYKDDSYEFDDWMVVSPSTVTISNNTFTMPVANVEVKATWKKINYTITINSGGTGTAASKNPANVGDEITLTPGNRAGYTFNGWTAVSPSTVTIRGNTFTMPSSNVEVTATWKAIDYTITVKQVAGIMGATASKQTANVGEKISLYPGFTYQGYIFDRWTVTPADLTIAADNTFIMPAENVEVAPLWKPIDYTITVNQGGGSGSAVSKSPAQVGETITLTPGTFKEGYAFDGWTVRPESFKIPTNNTFTMPAMTIEVTPKWKAIDYTITVKQGVGSGAGASKEKANIGEEITLIPGVFKDGYTFDRWTVVAPAGLTIAADNTFIMPAANIEVVAAYKVLDFTITINQGGGSGAAASKNSANVGNVITLTPGNRNGYTFDGWTVISPDTLTISGNSFTMPAANVEVTAKYKVIDYTITVNQGGGSGSQASKKTANVGEKIVLTVGTYKDGYRFDGWTVTPAGLTVAADNTFIMPAANVEITPTWKLIDYTITVNQGGGSGSVASKSLANAGETITLTPGNRNGYTFDGWTIIPPNNATISGNTFTMPNSNVEVTPTWKAIDYTITVKQGVGTGATASKKTANVGEKIALIPGVYKDGYTFDRWTIIAPVGLIVASDNTFTMPAANVEVTPTYKLIDYTITVNSDGGYSSSASKKTANAGEKISLTLGKPASSNYYFVGWRVVTPESGLLIAADNTFIMPDENVKIIATWWEKLKITSNHKLTAQGLELEFTAMASPQNSPEGVTWGVTWSVTGNDKVRFDGNVLKVATDAKPGTITVTVAINGHDHIKDERTITILPSTANAAGPLNTQAIKNDGTLWTLSIFKPGQEPSKSTWVSMSTGGFHTAAIKSNGTLWAWGSNSYGQLGNTSITTGDPLNSFCDIPVQESSNSTWVFVSAGYSHTAAIKSDGTLWAWGYNALGQLGNNSTINSNIPVQESSKSAWVFVSAGTYHTAAIKSDSTLWTWGDNEKGQLGNSTIPSGSINAANNTARSLVPVQESSKSAWVSVSAGIYHTAAIKSDSTLWTWGSGYLGDGGWQLGSGGYSTSRVPRQEYSKSTWVYVSAASLYTAAIKSDGTLWAWGTNDYGELGNNSATDTKSNIPMQESSKSTTWVSVSASGSHTAAIRSDGSLWAWGDNWGGQLGNSTIPTGNPADNSRSLVPVQESSKSTWRVYPAN